LDAVNGIVQTQPDKALNMLITLGEQYDLKGVHRARFALLYSDALELNGLAFPHDSLMYDAIEYYNDVKDRRNLGKAWLYLGKSFMQIDSITPAMYAFVKAKDALQPLKDDDLLELVMYEMASLHQEQHNINDALTLFQQSLLLSQRSGNKKKEGHLLLKIADLLYVSGDHTDSVQTYFDRAKEAAITCNDDELLYKVLTSNAIAQKEYLLAKQILYSSIKNHKQGIPSIECSSILGSIFFDLEQIDSARYYKKLVLNNVNATTKQRVNALSVLKEIEYSANNFEKALEYAILYQSLSDSIIQSRHAYNLSFAVQKYHLDRILREKNIQKRQFIIFIAFFCTILLLGGFFGYRYLMRRYLSHIQRVYAQKIEQNEETAKEYIRKSLLNGWNYALFEEKFNSHSFDLTTESDIAKMNKIAHLAYPGLKEWLINRFPLLSDNERVLTYLLITGFDPKVLCSPFAVTDSRAIYTRCSRLYHKLGIKTEPKDPLSFRYRLIDLYLQNIL
jgi:tetratricopeptide (TPR) repeat protein